jgi:hypothetical protein
LPKQASTSVAASFRSKDWIDFYLQDLAANDNLSRGVYAMKCNAMFCATSTFIVCLVIAAATLEVNAEETSISEKSFGCIRDSAVKVEGTYIRHADPARLKEVVQIFEGDVADKEDRQSGRLRVEYHGLLSRLPRAGS